MSLVGLGRGEAAAEVATSSRSCSPARHRPATPLLPARRGCRAASARCPTPTTPSTCSRHPAVEVSAVVVDADEYGTLFIADVHAVFPSVPVIAISREPARRAQAIRAGAVVALPRNASAAQLAKAIVRAAGS